MGKINFYHGVVKSRKSSELILTLHRNREIAGKSVLVLQSNINSRDGGYIRSRALKFEEKAEIVYPETNIKDLYNNQELVMLDEIQFFSEEHIKQLVEIACKEDVLIFCYGLMSDFKGRLFPTISKLLPFCTKIKEIETVCTRCGKRKATMNAITKDDVEVEGSISVGEHFEGVCLKCWSEVNR